MRKFQSYLILILTSILLFSCSPNDEAEQQSLIAEEGNQEES